MIDTISDYDIIRAKEEVMHVCSCGHRVKLVHRYDEGEVVLSAFPIRHKPFKRSIKEKVSWAEDVDIILYVAKREVEKKRLEKDDIADFSHIRIGGKTYEITYLDYYGAMGNDYLYYILGATK